MIKDMMVHVPTERTMQPLIEASLSLAARFGAQLEAVAAGYVSASAAYVMEGAAAAAVASVFEMEQQKAAERAAAALAMFEAEARKVGIACRCRSVVELPADAAAAIGTAARLRDLTVVLQADREQDTFDNTIPVEVMLQSGGPVLFVPYIFRGPIGNKRIGICWDGSRLASRALRDAMPFLAQAETLVAISINAADSLPAEAKMEDLVAHLARVGLSARHVDLTATRAEIQPTILSLAADENLDMLVMGAYGHSRFQEGLLGGVTREMLQSMTLPVLMSH